MGAQEDGEKEEEDQALHCRNGTALRWVARAVKNSLHLRLNQAHWHARIAALPPIPYNQRSPFALSVTILSEIEGCLRDERNDSVP